MAEQYQVDPLVAASRRRQRPGIARVVGVRRGPGVAKTGADQKPVGQRTRMSGVRIEVAHENRWLRGESRAFEQLQRLGRLNRLTDQVIAGFQVGVDQTKLLAALLDVHRLPAAKDGNGLTREAHRQDDIMDEMLLLLDVGDNDVGTSQNHVAIGQLDALKYPRRRIAGQGEVRFVRDGHRLIGVRRVLLLQQAVDVAQEDLQVIARCRHCTGDMKQRGLLQTDKTWMSGDDLRSDGRGTQGEVARLDVLPRSGHGRDDCLLIARQDGVDHRRDIGAQAKILRHDGDACRALGRQNAEHRAVLQSFDAETEP